MYACINVSGLAVGITCVLLAVLYVTDEHSFDSFHQANLFRVTSQVTFEGKNETTGGTGQVQGPTFRSQVPEVLNFSRVMGGGIYEDVRTGDLALRLQVLFVDDSFFDVFTFKLKRGDSKTALKNVNSVVITYKTALRFFGRLDVVGKTLNMDYEPSARRIGTPLVVSGVVEDPPANSSIQFDILFPFKFMKVSFDDASWLNTYLGTFVVLHPRANIDLVAKKFDQIHSIYAQRQLTESKRSNGYAPRIQYGLQRITDIHLNPANISDKTGEDGVVNGSKPIYSYLFLGIAIFILLMASINFVNVSIAISMRRTKEVGVRKVTGGTRFQILAQFLGESGLLCIIAIILALVLTFSILPVFNQLSGKKISFSELWSAGFMLWLTAIFLVNILFSGLYPAFLLSGFNPVQVLYRRQTLSGGNKIGNSLLTFQFFVAILLGICTTIFYQQMHFVQNKDLGYDPHQIVRIKIPGLADTKNMATLFKNELKRDAQIKRLSVTGEFGSYDTKVNDRVIKSNYRSIDTDYLPVLNIKIKEGRNFSHQLPGDKEHGILVNEAFVKASELTNPVGLQVRADPYFGANPFTIIGVVKNFHTGSFREEIRPVIMFMSEQYGGDAILTKVEVKQKSSILRSLENTFKKLMPGAVFDFAFLDEQNARAYEQELRWQKIISYATVLSVFICCIGLFALAHLSTAQRTRETGIRIVLGASVSDIVFLFSKGFLKLVLIAIFIAGPVAYRLMDYWLESFAYKVGIEWWVFVMSGGFAIITSLITVGSQAVKAAWMNPVNAIRSGNE